MLNIHPDSELWLLTAQTNERMAAAEHKRRVDAARGASRSSVRQIAGGALTRLGNRLSETS